jgi:hypothetical protein
LDVSHFYFQARSQGVRKLTYSVLCHVWILCEIQVLTAVSMKMAAFWDIAPYSIVEVDPSGI